MKVTPVSSPAEVKQVAPTDNRAKAVAAFNRTAAPQANTQIHPVQNANQVAPEEMSAIRAPSQQPESTNESTPSDGTEVQAVAEETPAVPEAPKAAKDPVLEKQFQELARQERILRSRAQKQAQDIKAQQDALKAQEAALNERAKLIEQGYISKDRFKADPLGALTEAGSSYDELVQQALNQQPRDPRLDAEIKALRDEIKSLRTSNEEGQRTAQNQQAEQYKAAVKQIQLDAQALVKSDPVAYEAIAKTNSIKDVVDLIEQTYHKDGVLLSVDEAATEVENYLVEQSFKTISRIDKIKKRLSQSGASTAPAKKETQQTQSNQKQSQPTPMKTLTNAASSTRKLSARERALLAFKGELKG